MYEAELLKVLREISQELKRIADSLELLEEDLPIVKSDKLGAFLRVTQVEGY